MSHPVVERTSCYTEMSRLPSDGLRLFGDSIQRAKRVKKDSIMETIKATVLLIACVGMLAVLCLFAVLSTYMQPARWVDRRAMS